MANPKKKHTPMRRDMRRSANFKLEAMSLVTCTNCGGDYIPHRVCSICGFYNGQLVKAPKLPKNKKEEK